MGFWNSVVLRESRHPLLEEHSTIRRGVSIGAGRQPVGALGDNQRMSDADYDHNGNVRVCWALLGVAQDAPRSAPFAKQLPELVAENTAHLGHADMAQVTASLQNFVLKYEVPMLGYTTLRFSARRDRREVLWRLTEARRFDTRESMLELEQAALVNAEQISKTAHDCHGYWSLSVSAKF